MLNKHAQEPKRLRRSGLLPHRPNHKPHGDRRLARILGVDSAQDLNARDEVQGPIEPAPVGNGINVAAERHSRRK